MTRVTVAPSRTLQATVVWTSLVLGTQLVARHSCSVSVLSASAQSSQSLKRNVVEKHLPQCSSSVLFCVLRTRCCSSEHFKHLCSPSKFSSYCCLSMFTVLWAFLKWDSWTRWVPPGATSTWNSLGKHSEEPLVSPPLFTVGQGSLYLLCFSGRLDSLDLQCLAGRAGEVIGECLTDLELSLRFRF